MGGLGDSTGLIRARVRNVRSRGTPVERRRQRLRPRSVTRPVTSGGEITLKIPNSAVIGVLDIVQLLGPEKPGLLREAQGLTDGGIRSFPEVEQTLRTRQVDRRLPEERSADFGVGPK